jgi:hypothetical protein
MLLENSYVFGVIIMHMDFKTPLANKFFNSFFTIKIQKTPHYKCKHFHNYYKRNAP